jgi:hypothetical protein
MEEFAVVQDVLLANYSPDLELITGSYLKFPKNKIDSVIAELQSDYALLRRILDLQPADYKPVAQLCSQKCKRIVSLCKQHRHELEKDCKEELGEYSEFDIFGWMDTIEKLNHTPEQFETGLAIFKPDIAAIKNICERPVDTVEGNVQAYIVLLYHYLESANSIVLGVYFLTQLLNAFYMLEVELFIGHEISWPDYFSTLVNWGIKCYLNNTIKDPLMLQEFNFKETYVKGVRYPCANPLYEFIIGRHGHLFSPVQLYKQLGKGPIEFDVQKMGPRCGIQLDDEVQVLRLKAYTTHLAVIDIIRKFPNADFDFWQLLIMIVLRIPLSSAAIIVNALDKYRQEKTTVPAATTTQFFNIIIQEMTQYHKKAFDKSHMRIKTVK